MLGNPDMDVQRTQVEMQYVYAQPYSEQQPPAVVRWVTRLTKFLRTTATTGANGLQGQVVRGLGGLGVTTSQESTHQHCNTAPLQPQHPFATPQQQEQQRAPTTRVRSVHQALEFSPPEQLPGASPQSGGIGPLFDHGQVQRMRAMEASAPHLYGSPRFPPSSTSSSEIQAEVQRQMKIFMERHGGESRRLASEVEALKRERDSLRGAMGQATTALAMDATL